MAGVKREAKFETNTEQITTQDEADTEKETNQPITENGNSFIYYES